MKRFTLIIFFICIFLELIFFVFAPKQAYMQGLLESWYASHGLIFYKDTANAFLPFLKFVMYFFHSMFGYSLNLSALLSPIFTIFTLILLYIVGKKYLKGVCQSIPLIFYIIWNIYLGGNLFSATSFLGFLLLVTLLIFNSWWKKSTKVISFITGFSFSLSVLTIQIAAPFVAILSAGILIKSIKTKKINHFILFCIGLVVPVLAVLFWVATNHIASEFLYWNVLYYFDGYPYGTSTKDLQTVFIFFAVHTPLLIFAIYKRSFITVFAVLALLFSFWYAVFHPMRFQISLPIIALLFGIGLDNYLRGKKNIAKSFLVGVVMGINILALFLFVFPYLESSFSLKNVNRLVSEVYPGDPMYDSVDWVKNNTPQTSKIFVLGDTYFYLVSQRLPANSRNTLGVEPMLFYPLNKFKKEIENSPPDYWAIDERLFISYSNWKADDLSALIKGFVKCKKEVARFDYWAIYSSNQVCGEISLSQ